MLIPIDKIKEILLTNNIEINGVLHIGAHECEELPLYEALGKNKARKKRRKKNK